jgi:hypothetical protein
MMNRVMNFIGSNGMWVVAGIIASVFIGRIAILETRNAKLVEAKFHSDTALVNTQARMDTTRQLNIELSDSLQLVARLAVQEEVDDVGEGNTVGVTELDGTIGPVRDSNTGTVATEREVVA